MHKYWGKKPSSDLYKLIDEYTNQGDTVLDPFAGYGVFGCEAFIANRNVILNDLNPIANFLNKQLLQKDVDLQLVEKQWRKIKSELVPFVEKWYEWDLDGKKVQLISVLRDKKNIPIRAKYKLNGNRSCTEFEIKKNDADVYLNFEKSQVINDWFPTTKLIRNSRISAKEDMTVADLFTKRTLSCHSRLLSLIETHSNGAERDLLKVAFTANLANCSKLVPPIKSRGAMAPGAWMTGFYIGETYLENNVLSYYENRFKKIIKGKNDYLSMFGNYGNLNLFQIQHNNIYYNLQNDAKKLDVSDESIDYVFTDPPYGDAVPYFEQSIIWNSWLKLIPDYKNEIVISDSKEREKGNENFEKEINVVFSEIRRVLKTNKYFSLTYHSLSGLEWKAITNACIKNGFELIDYKWLVQKSFTPRQINRLKSIKGDVLVTLRKTATIESVTQQNDDKVKEIFSKHIKKWVEKEPLDTNEIFIRIMKIVFTKKILIMDVNLLVLLTENFKFSDDNKWRLK